MQHSFLLSIGDWVHTTNSLIKRYTNLTNNLVKFESHLRVALVKWQSFDEAVKSVLKWIKKTERELQEISSVSSDVNLLHKQVSKLRVGSFSLFCLKPCLASYDEGARTSVF